MTSKRFFFHCLLFTGILSYSVLAKAAILGTPTISQISQDSLVIKWVTDTPATSQVRYSSARYYGDLVTPEYESNNTSHEVKISGLYQNEAYTFTAVSVDDSGSRYESAPIVFTPKSLPANLDNGQSIITMPHQLGFANSLLGLMARWRATKNQFIHLLQDTRDYSLERNSSLVFAFLAGVLFLFIYLAQEFSFFLFIDSLVAFRGWQLWVGRRKKNSFMVIDGTTNKPIRGAEVAVIDKASGEIVKHFISNVAGVVNFDWPDDKPVIIRVTKKGFQSASHIFMREVTDIMLVPLPNIVDNDNVKALKFRFRLHHSMRWLNLIFLIIGTVLLLPTLWGRTPLTDIAMILLYSYLWYLYGYKKPRRYHMAQVIDEETKKPIPNVALTVYRQHKAEKLISDEEGFVPLAYPIPDFVSIAKKGFMVVLRQIVPATAISSDPIIITIRPKD